MTLTQFVCRTPELMRLQHYTKSGYKKLSGSEEFFRKKPGCADFIALLFVEEVKEGNNTRPIHEQTALTN